MEADLHAIVRAIRDRYLPFMLMNMSFILLLIGPIRPAAL